VDIAKEAADAILLEKSLMVLERRSDRGPQGLRQHSQNISHGRQLKLWEHVQRAAARAMWLPYLPMLRLRS